MHIKVAESTTGKYFHGGKPGMKPGQFILPPSFTRARTCADFGAEGVCRRDRVYVTTEFMAATIYAAMFPEKKGGCVYLVVPVGEVEPDPDCSQPGLSFSAQKARIVKVFKLSRNEINMARMAVMA